MTRLDPHSSRRALQLVLIGVVAALVGFLATAAIRDRRAAPSTPPSAPRALSGATASPSAAPSSAELPMPSPAGVRRALSGKVRSPGLGGRLLARVVDARSGTVLYDRSGSTGAAPASTAKLMTAAAALDRYRPTTRFPTTVLAGAAAGTVVLVGGGDPTITAAATNVAGAYPHSARISALADQLRTAHVSVTRIVVDDSLFTGPAVSPNWAPGDAPSDYAAPITALMVDGGRANPTDTLRSGNPAAAAGQALAQDLGNPSIAVIAGRAPARAKPLARVYSAPLSVLIEQMLHQSDNVIAEVLARHVAIAAHRASSFLGAAHAVRAVLARLGARIGAGMLDGSGLSAADRVSPAALVAVLRVIAGTTAPSLRGIVGALPVARWSGTLFDRFSSATTASAAGRVRAKTGTLTGVSSIAGYVHDRSGRLLVFAFDADRAGATGAAEVALDRMAAALAGCGCR